MHPSLVFLLLVFCSNLYTKLLSKVKDNITNIGDKLLFHIDSV